MKRLSLPAAAAAVTAIAAIVKPQKHNGATRRVFHGSTNWQSVTNLQKRAPASLLLLLIII